MPHENNSLKNVSFGIGAQTASALFLLFSGVALATASLFIPPKGEIAGSVCWIFSQCLIYAGSVFGIKEYVRACARANH